MRSFRRRLIVFLSLTLLSACGGGEVPSSGEVNSELAAEAERGIEPPVPCAIHMSSPDGKSERFEFELEDGHIVGLHVGEGDVSRRFEFEWEGQRLVRRRSQWSAVSTVNTKRSYHYDEFGRLSEYVQSDEATGEMAETYRVRVHYASDRELRPSHREVIIGGRVMETLRHEYDADAPYWRAPLDIGVGLFFGSSRVYSRERGGEESVFGEMRYDPDSGALLEQRPQAEDAKGLVQTMLYGEGCAA